MDKVESRIIIPTIEGIQKEGLEYIGFLFFGLIVVNGDPVVIEYNCRMGDPETQSVFPRLKNDLVELCISAANHSLSGIDINIDPQTVASVVVVSGGYPGKYQKGKAITGLEKIAGSMIFHAGTKEEGQLINTDGGRVLAITSFGKNIQQALQTSSNNIQKLYFEGMYYRRDIGFDL
jgi:phosphoribosylamine--glycine ligase